MRSVGTGFIAFKRAFCRTLFGAFWYSISLFLKGKFHQTW